MTQSVPTSGAETSNPAMKIMKLGVKSEEGNEFNVRYTAVLVADAFDTLFSRGHATLHLAVSVGP